MIWIEIIKPIHLLPVGDIRQWHPIKANKLIASGHGKKVRAPKSKKEVLAKEIKVERAILEPKTEKAVLTLKPEDNEIPNTTRTVGTVVDVMNAQSKPKKKKK